MPKQDITIETDAQLVRSNGRWELHLEVSIPSLKFTGTLGERDRVLFVTMGAPTSEESIRWLLENKVHPKARREEIDKMQAVIDEYKKIKLHELMG